MKFKFLLVLFCVFFTNTLYADSNISTFNIRNFGKSTGKETERLLVSTFKEMQSDIIAVQEIVNADRLKDLIKRNFPKYQLSLSYCGGGGKQKLGIIFNQSKFELLSAHEDNRISDIDVTLSNDSCGSLRPLYIAKLRSKETRKEVMILVAHLKAGDGSKNYRKRWKQYQILEVIISELKRGGNENIIILGDFNTTGYILTNSDYSKFNELTAKQNLFDSAQETQCTAYWTGKDFRDGIEEPSILDHVLISKSLLNGKNPEISLFSHCAQVSCQPTSARRLGNSYEEMSDHCPVMVKLENL